MYELVSLVVVVYGGVYGVFYFTLYGSPAARGLCPLVWRSPYIAGRGQAALSGGRLATFFNDINFYKLCSFAAVCGPNVQALSHSAHPFLRNAPVSLSALPLSACLSVRPCTCD